MARWVLLHAVSRKAMQQQTTLSIWCERIIEAGWLLILTLIPIYFNLLSARHFEPDKATTLRAIVLVMAAAALVRFLERLNTRQQAPPAEQPDSGGNPLARLWQRLNAVPLAVPALFYALVFLIATVASVVPHTSFWGSYQRLQGTYTNLSYIVLFFLVVATLRRREQLERLITITLLAGLTVAAYGVLQHLQLDPLPWRGDVITRVASTMGNSIFVAAYLIMVVPLALYRAIASASEARQAPASSNRQADVLGALAAVLLVFGTLSLLLASIKFNAAVRTGDLRYWWVFPGAIITTTGLWYLLARRTYNGPTSDKPPLWPGILYGGYMLLFVLHYTASQGAHAQPGANAANALDWWVWMLVSVALVVVFYVMALLLPRSSGAPSRLSLWLQGAGTTAVVLVILVAIIFTQSRGPWIGLGTGLFVFFVLVLWQGIRNAVAQGHSRLARGLRVALGAWVGLTLVAGAFLVAFNLSSAPVFEPLRDVPYLGRMGSLLEVGSGTGRVRMLIWRGDDHAGGAVALITADPLRTVFGWGPESMFVAFNEFYPPDLAQLESRGASPDRSHQAILDELVTKGFLGLVSYFFVLISFGALCWRLIRTSEQWHWQVFFIACLSTVVAHFMEGLTGIPIVSTLTMFWVTLGITVTGGMLAGHYVIGALPAAAISEEADEATPAPETATKGRAGGKGGRRSAARSGAARAATRRPSGAASTNLSALALYTFVVILALGAAWWFNLSTVYADMVFQEAQSISERDDRLMAQVIALEKFVSTVNKNPREDFYYLNLGRSLMTIAQMQQSQGMPLGEERPNADAQDVLNVQGEQEAVTFVQTTPPLAMLSYAEAVLNQARELNPMNKDHYANLARLNSFWYNWTQDFNKLQRASEWYNRANAVAPQDVTLLNEHARLLMIMYSVMAGSDASQAQIYLQQADQLLSRSAELDPDYGDTTVRLAELNRLQGNLDEAVELYTHIIRSRPQRLDSQVGQMIEVFSDQPEYLLQLRDAYHERAERTDAGAYYAIAGRLSAQAGEMQQAVADYQQATELLPENLDYRLNYTLVLSDTGDYGEALRAARSGLALAQAQTGETAQQRAAQFEGLITIFQQKVAGGE
jgi:tetratricopeptide (TPR) repeat protein